MRKVGIVGGGQLGRMLIQAGIDFDLQMKVLDRSADSPCAGIAHRFQVGSPQKAEDIERFAEDIDLLTIELEEVSVEGLRRAAEKGIEVAPSAEVVELIQDKGKQRSWYAARGFPSPRFQLWQPGEAIQLEFPLIQKAFRGGYDGRGVQKVSAPSQLWQVPSLLEELVPIAQEVSVIVARSRSGEVRAFPPVEAVFHPIAHLVEYLRIPASLPEAALQEAQTIASEIAEALEVVGLLAVEFFYTEQGKWLVNESAPRPHNTGHITTRACWTSQFEQHWRALLGLPLGETRLHTYGALVNILGHAEGAGTYHLIGVKEVLRLPGVSLHLYGKKHSTPFRKLGHVLILAPSPRELLSIVETVRSALRVELAS
ncbi:MAG: 5-(carboxyamino)imidazole ribonucleotide synthase [Bacteroidia bacterium]|nr:5-(carboxyamino)imidazole ribonucleotide synthase [Bacteroidia bacterium]